MEKEDLIQKAVDLLKSSDKTAYRIWMDTGITQGSIKLYRDGIKSPTPAYANILIKYLESDYEAQQIMGRNVGNEGNVLNKYLQKENAELKAKIEALNEQISGLRVDLAVTKEKLREVMFPSTTGRNQEKKVESA